MNDIAVWEGTELVAGATQGPSLVLSEPLSFWGGLDAATGLIIGRHPDAGRRVTGRILVMESGRGSSSSSTVLAEALRNESGPAAIVLGESDEIVAVGSLVAYEMYGVVCPVIVAPDLFSGGVDSAAAARILVVDGGRIRAMA